jgi:hypothetical protein
MGSDGVHLPAAHQIEGNNLNSDFWLLENISPTIFKERSGARYYDG